MISLAMLDQSFSLTRELYKWNYIRYSKKANDV